LEKSTLMLTAIPLSLYVHLPWCVRKCPYCDFNSHALGTTPLPEEAYIDAVLEDVRHDAPLVAGRCVNTIFIGGGTPSLFSAFALGRLLEGIAAVLPLAPALEITLEANPGTVEAQHFHAFRAVGINRLSIGIQSFADVHLRALGRIHDSVAACAALSAAQKAGFDNFNVDLMFGLPGQNVTQALADVTTALTWAPAHLSWYQLTLEAHTAFQHAPPAHLPDEEMLIAIQEAGQALLAAQGWGQYEVSAYAQARQECRHNLNYWEFGDYLGIGAGAHGKITMPDKIIRTVKNAHPSAYLRACGRRITTLKPREIVPEFMLNALRLYHGFQPQLFPQRTGIALSAVAAPLAYAMQQGWLEARHDWIRPTPEGRRFLNEMLELFIADEDTAWDKTCA
jgi:putative oxygen-independent coproporphyrinogen III oxidase